MALTKSLSILGIRGIPAAHGGFETFAEQLAIYLQEKGWKVAVYCQEDGTGPVWTDSWRGIERVHIPVAQAGPKGTVVFDWRSTLHAAGRKDPCIVLGYNTAVFVSLLRVKGIPCVINMDGIEWARAKWGSVAKLWFWVNDWAGCWLGNHLVADHPQIKAHLETRVSGKRITTIPYGAPRIESAAEDALAKWGLESRQFMTVVARPEPENSILEIVSGFSRRKRGYRLVVLGNYDGENPYHARVVASASDEVLFIGAVYEPSLVQALRYHSAAYLHGHQVGGTNPSLVEALGAGNAVIAHDNRFNRWVAGKQSAFFDDADSLDVLLSTLDSEQLEQMRHSSRTRFEDGLTWPQVLAAYESLFQKTFHQ